LSYFCSYLSSALNEGKRNKSLTGEQNDANLHQKRTTEIAGEILNVSASVLDVSKIVNTGIDELKQVVTNGEMAVSTAAIIADLPKEEQKEVLVKGTKEAVKAAKTVKEIKMAKDIPATGELTTVKRYIATTLNDIRKKAMDEEDTLKLQRLLKGLLLLQKVMEKTNLKIVSGSL
jgi:hypothetical protein